MASAAIPGWKPLTSLDQEGIRRGPLIGALLTTFDPPDPGVLIEEYLPVWLGLENSFAEEGADRLRYFAELESALSRLKGAVAIVSSAGETATSAEAWIWNYIRRLEVGARGAAVQHAKLWMFHRGPTAPDRPETLELVVSSANLTRDGLRGQIQAGWRCILPLEARISDARMASWGVLPGFLVELRAACGSAGPKTIDRWLALLRRCNCPANIEFIASVPGAHSATTLARRQTAWGVAGLGAIWSGRSRPRLTAMTPTIGRWTGKSFKAWTSLAGVEPSRLSMAWVRAGHPWAGSWQLDAPTEEALTGSGIRWLEVPHPFDDDWDSALCDDHRQNDLRWSHAKLYELREGARRRLLITSANFSRAAWGDPRAEGGLDIANFELGVSILVRDGFRDRLRNSAFGRATCYVDYAERREPPIAWLAAEWGGNDLFVECRTTADALLAPHVVINVARAKSGEQVSVNWSRPSSFCARIPWTGRCGVPILVGVETLSGHTRHAAVADVRSTDDPQILCSEFDEDLLRQTLDALIEEKYGYIPIRGLDGAGADGGAMVGAAAAGADYAVPAYVDARRRFQLVDNWWRELCDADDRTRPFILNDGKRIRERWSMVAKSAADRGLRLAAKVAVDELAFRIQRCG